MKLYSKKICFSTFYYLKYSLFTHLSPILNVLFLPLALALTLHSDEIHQAAQWEIAITLASQSASIRQKRNNKSVSDEVTNQLLGTLEIGSTYSGLVYYSF